MKRKKINDRLKITFINTCLILFLEFSYGLLVFDNFEKSTIISILIYSLFASLIISTLTSIFNKKINTILNYIIYFLLGFWFSLELIFYKTFNTFFSISLFSLSDQILDFQDLLFRAILTNLHAIIIFFLPLLIYIIFKQKLNFSMQNQKKFLIIPLLLLPLIYLGYTEYIKLYQNQSMSIYTLYYQINQIPLSIKKLGVLSTTRLDIHRSLFGFEEQPIIINQSESDSITSQETSINQEEIFTYDDNILELDLSNPNLNTNVKNYIENEPATTQNKYTGIFKDKNLIYIVAESFSEIAVSQEYTPTLYKLINTGFVFENFYSPYYLSTIGGEYQALTGLYPDSSILKKWRSGTNSFPLGLATVFQENGYNTYAYHNNSGYFQDRNSYLKSLGFNNFEACYLGNIITCNKWPESDTEMIDKTTDLYLNADKFMTYYMTVSGHMAYTWTGNSMAKKHQNKVANTTYSENAKAYLATQIELDQALELLLNRLEESQQLNDTVIIMVADHYPYGLSLNEVNELSTYQRDSLFEVNHNSLIIWNNQLNTITIDKVAMSADIIPTIYNLFGIAYDSRLFIGKDIFSNSDGLAIMGNRSWITNQGKYNSTTGTYTGEGDDNYIATINNIVQNRLTFSKNILTNNSYAYIDIIK